jgi:hypothetical protein
MLEFHPDRANPGSLWGAATAAKKQAQQAAEKRRNIVIPRRGLCPRARNS